MSIHHIDSIPFKENVVFFDVDDTLVLWGRTGETDVEMPCPYLGSIEKGKAHKEHVQRLKDHSEAGHFVIVWSAGGALWAKEAVRELGLADHVDMIMEKPMQYYDDIKADEFMGTRSYIGDSKAKQRMIGQFLGREDYEE